jgi:hypothetical protein
VDFAPESGKQSESMLTKGFSTITNRAIAKFDFRENHEVAERFYKTK